MDWLKRLFFHYEDDEEEIEWKEIENKKTETKDEHIEMQTRVAFQYPRNQNQWSKNETKALPNKNSKPRPQKKLPISEIQHNLYERYPELKNIHKQTTTKNNHVNIKQKPVDSPPFEKTKTYEKPTVQKQPKEKTKIGNRRFRPTEVPSPIYGFQKRKPDTELVEFELGSLESGPSTTDEQLQRDHINEIVNHKMPNEEIMPEQNIDEHGPIVEIEQKTTDELNEENKNIYVEENQEEPAKTEDLIYNEEKIADELGENPQMPIFYEEDKNGEPEEESAIANTQETGTEVFSDSTVEIQHPTKEPDKENPVFHQSEKEEAEQPNPINVNEEKQENSFNTSDKIEERKTRPKRHIPFNVLMLKSDREKLKKRQEAERRKNKFLQMQLEKKNEKINRELNNIEKKTSETERKQNPNLIPSDELGQEHNLHSSAESKQNNNLNPNDELQQNHELNDQNLSTLKEVAVTKEVSATKVENEKEKISYEHYEFPSRQLLHYHRYEHSDNEWIQKQREILDQTLKSFNVGAKVVNVSVGPAVTRFELSPDMGVKVSKITGLTDDIKLSLAAKEIRIEAPIPGKHTIGIEVPNRKARPVFLREIIDQPAFKEAESPLTVALGLDITGKPIMTDLKKMPHGLIAGATGSGKSVSINTFIVSLLYKARPDEVKLLLIDPKMVELAPYNGIPHLISPVITNVKAATQSLKWAVEEMERRYELFAHVGVRDISKFNEKADKNHRLPYFVIIIDELADLMMMAPSDVEEAIARIAQKARACGIHLLIATQRPSVDVITGLIKANIPTRIAFSVSSQIDSRTILDVSGAERLLGKGDMLFIENGTSKPVRIQGAFISDEEIEKVVDHVRSQGEPDYLFEQEELIRKSDFQEQDELLFDACKFAVEQGNISTSSLQRQFRIGYNRAARMIDMMEEKGIITESKGSKPRDVLITEQDLEKLKGLN